MDKSDFIKAVIGKPWANRSCTFGAMDCWALVVLYYRHVLGIELHQTADYEAGADFFTCYQGDVVFWRKVDKPVEGGIFVGYGLYSIAESLPDERLGYFDYTFDDENDSLGDRVQAICNAASVVAYWDDGVLTFTRDQKVDYPAAVFNRANMKTDEYKMTYEATLPGGYDGVQVSYVHPTTNNKTYINYRVLNGAIVEQEAENPNKLEIVGFRNEYQARERALRETKRLIYSRVKMNAKVFEDGIIQVGSVIQMPDIYDSNQQQGYITGRSGNNFDTSEPITFTGSMYVLVTDSLGNPTLRYPATARSDTKYGFTAAIPNIQLNIWNGDTVQLPSRYLIATVEELDSQLWTVNSIKPNTDNTVSLTVAEYSDAIYE